MYFLEKTTFLSCVINCLAYEEMLLVSLTSLVRLMSVHTGRHRHWHGHRQNGFATHFHQCQCWCRCLCRCWPVWTVLHIVIEPIFYLCRCRCRCQAVWTRHKSQKYTSFPFQFPLKLKMSKWIFVFQYHGHCRIFSGFIAIEGTYIMANHVDITWPVTSRATDETSGIPGVTD